MSAALLSPEARLLFLAAGGPDKAPALDAVLREPLDWPRIYGLAAREQAVPILARRLRREHADRLPEEVASHLGRVAMVSEFKLLRLEQRLAEITDVLRDRGTRVLLLKGAALGKTVYSSFAERPMGDLDVLIEPENARDAWELLVARGWTPEENGLGDAFYQDHHHLAPLVDAKGTRAVVELHTDLFPSDHPFRLTPAEVWADARPVLRNGRQDWVPSTTHQLLHLCIHFAWSHAMAVSAWRAFRDLAALLDQGDLDWEEFVQTAQTARAGTCVYWTFRLACRAAGVHTPDSVLEALRPPRSGPVLRALESHLIREIVPAEGRCPSVRVSQALWAAAICPEWSGHGKVRPWHHAADLLARRRAVQNKEAGRALNHVHHLRAWKRYLLAVFGSRPDTENPTTLG